MSTFSYYFLSQLCFSIFWYYCLSLFFPLFSLLLSFLPKHLIEARTFFFLCCFSLLEGLLSFPGPNTPGSWELYPFFFIYSASLLLAELQQNKLTIQWWKNLSSSLYHTTWNHVKGSNSAFLGWWTINNFCVLCFFFFWLLLAMRKK